MTDHNPVPDSRSNADEPLIEFHFPRLRCFEELYSSIVFGEEAGGKAAR